DRRTVQTTRIDPRSLPGWLDNTRRSASAVNNRGEGTSYCKAATVLLDSFPRRVRLGDRAGRPALSLVLSQQEGNMGVLYLMRHGQASCGTDDYDRLSDLGHEQSRLAGRHLGGQGVHPIRIVHGQMLRQKQTAEGILNGLDPKPEAEIDPGWNEFNAWELTGALGEIDPRAKHDSTVFQAEL